MPTTSSAALVEHAQLVQSNSSAGPIPVGCPAWYSWLADATSFVFRGDNGTFTAHKERRGATQAYWKAYRRRAGRLHRVYLGRSEELTFDRLNAAAAELAGGLPRKAPSILAAPLDGSPAVVEAGDEQRRLHTLDQPFHRLGERSVSDTPALESLDDALSLHLLSTKLAVPSSHTNLAPRPRLVSRLDTAISQGRKLILIAAPAGFGKTTAIAEWLAEKAKGKRQKVKEDAAADQNVLPFHISLLPFRAAWLALDDADNQLNQFLAYLIAALETVRPRAGGAAWELLRAQAAHPSTQAILTLLLNALAAPAEHIILILDDYHTIALQTIHEAIAFLLDRMPPHMHVVITTRADPPLPLARLRARGQPCCW